MTLPPSVVEAVGARPDATGSAPREPLGWPDRPHTRGAVLGGGAVSLAACLVLGVVALTEGRQWLVAAFAATSVVIIAGAVFHWRTGKTAPLGHAFAASIATLVVARGMSSETTSPESIAFLTAVPAAVLFAAGPRAAIVWSVVAALIICVSYLADARGWFGHLLQPVGARWASSLTLYGLVLATSLLFHRDRARAMASFDVANRQLADARAIADAANRARGDYLATMAHELRTPLSGTVGLASVLLDSRLDADQRNLITTMQRSGEHLLELFDDIVDLERMDAGRLELRFGPVNLREQLFAVRDLFVVSTAQKGLVLDVVADDSVPQWVISDGARLRQVLTNLVSNAVKFTDRGRISVRMEGTRSRSGAESIHVHVVDTGVGVPAELRTSLFSPYAQAPHRDPARRRGAGLGLAISQRVVQALGGEIGFETAAGGHGSHFWFRVPVTLADAVAQGPARPPPRRVLVVDDDVVSARVAGHLLANMGIAVTVVGDANTALAALDRGGIDLVLMDCQLPGVDGFEATRRIRARAGFLPVIGMTATASLDAGERALAAGMDELLIKPLAAEELTRALTTANR